MEQNENPLCPKCEKELATKVVVEDGNKVRVGICIDCGEKVYFYPICALCLQPIADLTISVYCPGYRENSEYVHGTCLFQPEHKFMFISSMFHMKWLKKMEKLVEESEKTGTTDTNLEVQKERMVPFFTLDDTIKAGVYESVKIYNEFFEYWEQGSKLAQEYILKKNAQRRSKKVT